MKNYFLKALMIIPMALLMSCSQDNESSNTTNDEAISFQNLTFNETNAYFSSDGSMSAPVNESQAAAMPHHIDITFIYNYDYFEPGFFDPKARSQDWYWDDYHESWLSTAVETQYYATTLTKADFDAAATQESLIAEYFAETTTVLAPHAIFPTGSCVGGRESYDPLSVLLTEGAVFGFKNVSSGKRGLIYIRTDQSPAWPIAFADSNTKVDLIREN